MNAEVKKAAAEFGLFYPPDPSSADFSSIGGNAATNARGLCCVKYGVTGAYVLGMEVVLADGVALRLGGARLKDAAGLSLTQLFVGSEGILGVITELTLRLIPTPAPACTLVATFVSIEEAAGAVVAIAASLRPSLLELMDRTAINAVEDHIAMGLDRTAGALLLARSDTPSPVRERDIRRMQELCLAAGAVETFHTDDVAEGEAFATARRATLPALERLGSLLIEDVGVGLGRLPALVRGVEEIAERNGIRIAVVAHAGDGNTHPVIVFDPANMRERESAAKAFDEIMALALQLDGTITGEHGVGRLKSAWLPKYLGDDVMAVTQRVKHALDPLGILNPGAVLAHEGS